MDESALVTWTAELSDELGLGDVLDIDVVLKLAADAAHGVMRPAAPLTTFLAGLAIGRAGADPAAGDDVLRRIRGAIDRWDAAS